MLRGQKIIITQIKQKLNALNLLGKVMTVVRKNGWGPTGRKPLIREGETGKWKKHG